MIPLAIVAAIGWPPASGSRGFVALSCNDEIPVVASTLGGTAAADVLTNVSPLMRLGKLAVGGLTFLAMIVCMALYVAINTRAGHLDPQETMSLIGGVTTFTLLAALSCELLTEVK
jgi:hypothetical protein